MIKYLNFDIYKILKNIQKLISNIYLIFFIIFYLLFLVRPFSFADQNTSTLH